VPEWDAEIEIDTAAARRLIYGQFPELAGMTIERVAAGWDNVVHLVDDRWAFRFPRRAIAVPGVEREVTVLGQLAAHVPLPIPEPRWIGVPTDDYPWPWFGAPYLPGRELAVAEVADSRRVELAAALGGFLRALHAPRVARLVGTALPVDPNRRADMAWRVPMARDRLARVAELEGNQTSAEILALLADAERLPPSSRTRVLHGDLHARHVIVDAEGRLSGVIDWGDVCIGDPSIDLSIGYSAFAGDARAAFLDAYGRVDWVTALRARALGVGLSAALLEYAVNQDMAALRENSRQALERVVA
jgi:aminoglycoside phosphotransferase (APT) family kinase protein